jgi:glycosyltransferase involved in cell wall biosynthesis
MRYPNTGFFYFGKSLAESLIKENRGELDISLYTHSSVSRKLLPTSTRLINKSLYHKLIFPYKFDLTHFSDQYCHPKPWLVKGKKIITIHDLNPIFELESNPTKQKRYIKKMQRYVRIFDHIVTISNYVAEQIIYYFPESKEKISVIYNGADKLLPVESGYVPLYQPSRPFLFTIGILSPRKNFHVLPALLENNNVELVIAGIINEGYKEKIIDEAQKFNCVDRVKIIGTITDNDRAFYYQNCEAFLFPSLAEGFGLPVIEAMHFGKPVFLSRLTSLPEIGGEEAFYFESFEAIKMQEVFERGIHKVKDPQEETSICKHAETFQWSRTAAQYLDLYAEVLKAK